MVGETLSSHVKVKSLKYFILHCLFTQVHL